MAYEETLEKRQLLAVFTVDSLAPNASDGVKTLREAVITANAKVGPTPLSLTPG